MVCLLRGAMGATAERGSMRTVAMTFCIRFTRGRRVVINVFGPRDRNYFTVILLKFGLLKLILWQTLLFMWAYLGILSYHYATDAKYYKSLYVLPKLDLSFNNFQHVSIQG